MKKYVYQVFNKYFNDYKNNVKLGISALIRASDTEILLVCLEEMNKVMDIVSGRLTSILDIPNENRFPSTKQFNSFLRNVDIDLDKLFTTSQIIVNDTQNVVNYNSTEREAIVNTLTTVQGNVYSAYVMSQKGISGVTIIREDFNNEESANTGSSETKDVIVDTKLKRLSMKPINAVPIKDNTAVNTSYIDSYHTNELNANLKAFPNSQNLSHGSFWNISNNSKLHFTQKSDMIAYKKYILYNSNDVNQSLGSCQFESVITIDVNGDVDKRIQKEFSEAKQIPESYIFINRPISVRSKYITTVTDLPKAEVKLIIPFTNATLSTGCEIVLNPNDGNEFPVLNANKSYVKSSVLIDNVLTTKKVGITCMTTETVEKFGTEHIYSILFNEPIVPQMLELVLSYDSGWPEVQYTMSWWLAEYTKTFDITAIIEGETPTTSTISYKRTINLLIDSNNLLSVEQSEVDALFRAEGVK